MRINRLLVINDDDDKDKDKDKDKLLVVALT